MARRAKKETLAEKIERYRVMNETIGDPDMPDAADSDELFYEITRGDDPAVIRPLLLLRPYADIGYSDEMTQIIEQMENYPPEVFLDEFVPVAGELSRTSPVLMEDLLPGLLRNARTALLLERLGWLNPADRASLGTFVEGLKASRNDDPDLVGNCDRILIRIRELAS